MSKKDNGERGLVVTQTDLVQGDNFNARTDDIKDKMASVRLIVEQPGATTDFAEKARERARLSHERKAAAAAKRGQTLEPFDESAFPPAVHIKAATFERLKSLFGLALEMDDREETGNGWQDDPMDPVFRAYFVRATCYAPNGAILGQSRQCCSTKEQRFDEAAKIMAMAETRARARAIRQAIGVFIPLAYQSQAEEEMPPPKPIGEPTDGYERAPRPPDEGLVEESPASAVLASGGSVVTAKDDGELVEVKAAAASDEEPDFGFATQLDPEEDEPEQWPHPVHNSLEDRATFLAALEPNLQKAFRWAVGTYDGAVSRNLMPGLSQAGWSPVAHQLVSIHLMGAAQQQQLITLIGKNKRPPETDAPEEWKQDPVAVWEAAMNTAIAQASAS